ncbi:MAG: hypothetical protein FJY77_04665 [Candidatus Altiarchaeales archaeon]|nr:hypothetical protein [Candidatus Altiarchaeales archaeon]
MASVNAADPGFQVKVSERLSQVLCGFYSAIKDVATGIAAVVMVIAAVKWTASENDPGARKAAKDAMIHAIIGLMLLNLIDMLIAVAYGTEVNKLLCQPQAGAKN